LLGKVLGHLEGEEESSHDETTSSSLEKTMLAIARLHIAENNLSVRDFLRASYSARYGLTKEIPPTALREAEEKFNRGDIYELDFVIRFLRGIYGAT